VWSQIRAAERAVTTYPPSVAASRFSGSARGHPPDVPVEELSPPVTLGETGGGVDGWAVVLPDGSIVSSDPTICVLEPEPGQVRPVAELCPRASLRLPI